MKLKKQGSKVTNKIIWRGAGRIARLQGKSLEACPNLKHSERDTYGDWLMQQWREGWKDQNEVIRQRSLFVGAAQ